jgi:hypothetical protein
MKKHEFNLGTFNSHFKEHVILSWGSHILTLVFDRKPSISGDLDT